MNIIDKIEDKSEGSQYLYFRPFIKGTNIEIRKVLHELSQGKSHQEIILEQPEITQDHILTCLEYATALVGATEFKKAIAAVNAINKKRERFDNAIDELAKDWTKYFPNLDNEHKDETQQ
ncbi:DUF433 domain-containing protein [Flavobacterium filum]|uniref:DUF433 domain-containing protein n=1 Tax=Flavobacterium filum TaxID=370974 RepID=UPI0023F571C7|nr:DUF433 domain-containing protein [Flavobacterium filum]